MRYQLDVSSTAQQEIKALPGNYRQRLRRLISALSDEPRPSNSRRLDFEMTGREARRIRVDHWRIVYAVTETEHQRRVAILAVRRRPPYDYNDLAELFS